MNPESILELIYIAIIAFALFMAFVANQDNRHREQIQE